MVATLVAGGSYVPLDPCQPERAAAGAGGRARCRLVVTAACDGRRRRRPRPGAGSRRARRRGLPVVHVGLDAATRRVCRSRTSGWPATSSSPSESLPRPREAPRRPAVQRPDVRPDRHQRCSCPLCTGGRTRRSSPRTVPAGLRGIADNAELTWSKATPIAPRTAGTDAAGRTMRLRSLVVGGEAFRARLAKRLAERDCPAARIFNEYGPTEAVVGCMIHEAARPPISRTRPTSRSVGPPPV